MALKRISDLDPATTPLAGTETLELETAAGQARKATAQDIVALASGAVTSVNGQAGAVILDASGIGITDSGGYFTGTDVEAALQELGAGGGGGGSGDVVGPASSTNSNVALFDGVTGKLLKDGGALGTAAFANTGSFATAAQGALAASATQPGDLAAVATSGAYSDLTGTPPPAPVSSVNGQAGVVVLDASDVGAAPNVYTIITEASAFTATVGTHNGAMKYIRSGGNVTFSSAQAYTAGMAFTIRATAALELVGSGVTLTPTYGGTLELEAEMLVTVVMTSATAGDVNGQTVAAP